MSANNIFKNKHDTEVMSFIAGYLLGLESAGQEGVISPLVVTKNGSYRADRDIDGFSPVTVDVPIIEKTITKNGTYHAADDGAEGFDPITVNVPDRYNEGVQDTLNAINGNGSISADDSSLDDTIKGFAMASGDIEVNSTTTGQYAELVFYKYTHEELGSDWWVMGWKVFDSQTGEKISSNCGEIPAAWG